MYKNTTRVEKLNSILMSIFIVLSLFNPVMIASAVAGETISIGSSIVEPGDTFVLPITIANSAGVEGVDLNITYDQNIITVVSVLANSSISGSGVISNVDNINGVTKVVVTNDNFINATSATPFVDITFQAVSSGISALNLQDVSLSKVFTPYDPGTVNNGEIRVNGPPTLASIGSKSIDENSALTFTLSASDPGLDTLTYSAVDLPTGSTLDGSSGLFTWTPTYDQAGTYPVQFNVTDDTYFDSETVTITVNDVNRAPVLDPIGSKSVNENSALTFILTASDADGDSLNYSAVGLPSGASLNDASGSFVWTPTYEQSGTYSVQFNTTDGALNDSETVSITVNNLNRAPVATADSDSTNEDTPVTTTVLSNDSDIDGDALTVTGVTDPSNGTAVINSGTTVIYTPDADFNGGDSYTYTISDSNGGTDTATVAVTVSAVNDAPVATDDTITTFEDISVDITLSATDVDGDSLTYLIVSGASHGTITLSGNTATYTPTANYNGTDSFTFKTNDSTVDSNTATISITVSAVNDVPVATADTATTSEDTPVTTTVLSNDSDADGDALTVTGVTDPSNGTAVINSGTTVIYTPDADFNGGDSYTYTISDSNGGTDTATVAITVSAVNDAPVATDDTASINEDTSVDITLSATDVDGDSLTYLIVDGASHGTVALSGNTATYTPTANYNGTDNFTFKTNDSTVDSNTATISITVSAVNDVPVATADTATTSEDTPVTTTVLSNDSDVDGDSLTVTGVTDPSNGTAVINGDTTVTYTPDENFNGVDTYTYTISDGNGGTDTATVTITVSAVNDAPVSNADTSTTSEDTSVDITLSATDVDGDSLTYFIVGDVSHGTVTLSGNTATYTPTANYNGTDSFTFKANDSTFDSNIATVTITVSAVNDIPVATADTASTNEDTSVDITLSATDADGDSLAYLIVAGASHGTVTLSGNTATYTPTANYNGSDSFTFKTNDGTVDSNTATVTITINAVNDAPVATADTSTTSEDTPVTTTVLSNDSDVDGDTLTVTGVTNPTNGAAMINSGTTVTYTPDENFNGVDSYTYTISDGNGGTDTATVTITVSPVNDAPVLDMVSDITVTELDAASITVSASDADGDSLAISNSINMPVTATFNETTTTFTWITTYDTVKYTDSEIFTGMIIVTDSGGLSDNQTVNITVNNKNRAPTLLPLSNITIKEGGTFTLNPIAVDSDKDELTFVYLDVPDDFVGGDGTWKVNASDDYTIDVSVVDSGGLYDNQSVAINVTGLPPKLFVVNPVDDAELNSMYLNVSGSAYDKNLVSLTLLINDILSIDLTANVSDIINGGGWFEQNITLVDGTYTLEFNASDASSSTVVTRTVVVNTTKPNNAPVLTITSPSNNSQITSESNVTTVSGYVTDDSGIPEVLVSIGSMDKVVGVSKDGYFGTNVNLVENQNTITVTATDASGESDTETLVVNYTKLIPVDTVDPILILTYPPNGLEVGFEKLLVTGYTTDNVGIKNVTVNGDEVTLFNGVFSKEVTLSSLNEGNNTITVVATDTSGNNVIRTRTVMYDEPVAKDGLIKVEKISLSVSQNSLYAGSGNISNVTAFATDIAGRPANDSEIVKFVTVTNNGATQTDVQIENGTAVLSVTATEEPQTIIVIASNDTMVLASTQVVVKPNIEIKEIMDNISITVGGKTAGKSGVVLLDGLVNIQTDPSVAAELVNASEDDEVTLTVDVGTGSSLEIKMENAMLTDGGNLTGEVSGIILKNRPIKTDFTEINETVGEVTIDVNVEFNGNTVPGTLTFEMSGHKSIDDVVSSVGGEDAGGVDADTIKDNIAKKLKDVYKKNADKTHVDNGVAAVIHAKLDGASNDDIENVPISLTLNLDWFNNVAGGNADNVKVFEINETTGEIEATLDCVVVNNGDGTVTISATASGFSSYAFTSTTTAPDIEDSNDDVPSSSGGGGGGSGSSGETFENIEVKDVIREYIAIDSVATYEFIEDANAIGFVTFDAKTNAGYITATVEVLKDTSALVSAAPSGEVYQNMNIWIGKSGYATETNIANPVIGFKVVKSWIAENNIDESTINLNRYSSGAWNKLPTTKTGEDESYIYFSSETPGFSPFAITGDEISSTAVANVPDTSSTVDDDANEPVAETANVPDDEDKSSGGFAMVIGLIGMSVLGVGMYLRKDEIGKWINQRR